MEMGRVDPATLFFFGCIAVLLKEAWGDCPYKSKDTTVKY